MTNNTGPLNRAIAILEAFGGTSCPVTFELTSTKAAGGRSRTILGAEGSPTVGIMYGAGSRLLAGEGRYSAETEDELRTLAGFIAANPGIIGVGALPQGDALSDADEYEDDPE